LVIGASTGVSIVIAQYFGAKDEPMVRKTIVTGAYLIMGASVVMGILGILLSRWLLILLRTPDTIIAFSETYMKITFFGMVGIAAYNAIAFILRALGDSVTPLLFLIIASILNVGLDLLFVIVFSWGIAGVAIATVIAQAVAAISCIIYARSQLQLLRIPLGDWVPDRKIAIQCLRIGLPLALQNSFVSISTMVLQRIINNYGEVAVAAATILGRLEQFIFEPGCSVGIALSSFTGQNIGAKKEERIEQGFITATMLILGFSLIVLPLIYFFGEDVIHIFVKEKNSEVVAVTFDAIRITSIFYFFVEMIFVTRNFLSGAGDTRIPMLMGLCEIGCRMVLTTIFSRHLGFEGIWWATVLNWILTSGLGIFWVWSGKWRNKTVI
jgi:putative MATE family efflux protein